MTERPQRSKTPWAIAGVAIIVGGFVAALVSGGGSGSSTTDRGLAGGSNASPQAVKSVVVRPPVNGEKVLAAKQLSVGGTVYRTVLSTPRPGRPLYVTLYVGASSSLSELDRVKLPFPWAGDSRIAQFAPSPNADKQTASVLLSWYLHKGDTTAASHDLELTPHGIQVSR